MDEQEYLTPEDYGALTRASHAKAAADDQYQYLLARLFAKLQLRPEIDFIEPDGRITRAAMES